MRHVVERHRILVRLGRVSLTVYQTQKFDQRCIPSLLGQKRYHHGSCWISWLFERERERESQGVQDSSASQTALSKCHHCPLLSIVGASDRSRKFEGTPRTQACIIFLTLTTRLFRGESDHKNHLYESHLDEGDRSHQPRNQEPSAVTACRQQRETGWFVKRSGACHESICSRPEDPAPMSRAVALRRKLTSTAN